jgi:hypothetical protein
MCSGVPFGKGCPDRDLDRGKGMSLASASSGIVKESRCHDPGAVNAAEGRGSPQFEFISSES